MQKKLSKRWKDSLNRSRMNACVVFMIELLKFLYDNIFILFILSTYKLAAYYLHGVIMSHDWSWRHAADCVCLHVFYLTLDTNVKCPLPTSFSWWRHWHQCIAFLSLFRQLLKRFAVSPEFVVEDPLTYLLNQPSLE